MTRTLRPCLMPTLVLAFVFGLAPAALAQSGQLEMALQREHQKAA